MSTTTDAFLDLQAALAGEYSLVRELGRGGMGVVYLARDVQLDRHVAIKVLPAHLAQQPESRARFLREARTAAGLSHPHIVPIHRVGEAKGFVFFVMSYVEGETLGERLRRQGALPPADVSRIMREVAWALAYAHGRGIVHRDVKPDNIMLEAGSGRALVTDFGIAQVGVDTTGRGAGRIMGTAQFMSPEQASSEPVDGRSDLYALGAVGYLAASGRLPFDAASVPALLLKHVTEDARALSAVAPGLPAPLARAIERCLEKDPAERFGDGEALASALVPADEGRPALPPALRAWLSERNPATIPSAIWVGLVGIPFLSDINQFLLFHRAFFLVDMLKLGVLAGLPLVPLLGFHAHRAQRLFRAGYTLADLRGALDVGEQERASELLDRDAWAPRDHRAMRVGLWASAAVAIASTFFTAAISLPLELRHIVVGYKAWQALSLGSWLTTLGLLIGTSLTRTRVLPEGATRRLKVGLRERLWRSRLGEVIARSLGAPAVSGAIPAGAFQPTELALGGAAGELFAALPASYRERVAELPAVVAALEDRARDAREAMTRARRLAAREPGAAAQEELAKAQLASAVGALESIRIDLLRLHAGASDLAPLTTLLDAAREAGAELGRMSRAQEEVEGAVRRAPARREATPV